MPQTVDDRARHPPIARVGEDGRCGAPSIGERCRGRRAVELGKEESRRRERVLRDVAAIQAQTLLVGKEAPERGVFQRPFADEAVVARIAGGG
jgi:hypothetical protein